MLSYIICGTICFALGAFGGAFTVIWHFIPARNAEISKAAGREG